MVEAENEDELRAFAVRDPVVTTGTASIEVGTRFRDLGSEMCAHRSVVALLAVELNESDRPHSLRSCR